MKKILILCSVLFLAGCGTLKLPSINISTDITLNTLYAAEASYGVALSGARTYKSLCVARAIPKTCRDVVVRLQAADYKAVVALGDAAAFVKQYPTLNASNIIGAAKQAVDDYSALVTANK